MLYKGFDVKEREKERQGEKWEKREREGWRKAEIVPVREREKKKGNTVRDRKQQNNVVRHWEGVCMCVFAPSVQ